jgi:hypothetical protein
MTFYGLAQAALLPRAPASPGATGFRRPRVEHAALEPLNVSCKMWARGVLDTGRNP